MEVKMLGEKRILIFCILIAIFGGCVGGEKPRETIKPEAPVAPPATQAPTPSAPIDTTPPAAITGISAMDAYDGRVVLSWTKSTTGDFSHYNIYISKSEIRDVAGMMPVKKLTDIGTNTYPVPDLELEAKYYFSVTAVDKSGNENKLTTSVSVTPAAMPRGTTDPEIYVDVYRPEKAWAGTTLLPDNHNIDRPRVIEVNMLGEIVWEYRVRRRTAAQ